MNDQRVLGIIGGSGVYEIDGLEDTRWTTVSTNFGEPSDQLLEGRLDGQRLVFLPRHGRGHKIPPNELNFRANIEAMKRLGVTDIVSLSAVGSLKEDLPPGTFVVVDQFIDRTRMRASSFFGTGLVAHVSMAHPICERLADALEEAARGLSGEVARGGTYVAMEGPQFSSRAESQLYRQWGASVIGMTNLPEAKLAREAEICYATVAMVTDFDCWHPDHEAVTVDQVVRVLMANSNRARRLVERVASRAVDTNDLDGGRCPRGCNTALDNAIMTAPEARDPQVVKRVSVVAARALGKQS